MEDFSSVCPAIRAAQESPGIVTAPRALVPVTFTNFRLDISSDIFP
jgi:hypothetical protein